MSEDELIRELSSDLSRKRGGRYRLCWADVCVSTFLVVAVAVPTMAVEEDWHGHRMIDEQSHLWIIAACLVAVAFLGGGAVAGYRSPTGAAIRAIAATSLAVAVLLVGAESRRLWLAHKGVSAAVAQFWCLGVAAALLLSGAGWLIGRLSHDWRRLRSLPGLNPTPGESCKWHVCRMGQQR